MKAIIGLTLATVALWVNAADNTSKASVPASKPALTVNVVTPTQLDINQQVLANGSLAAWQEAIIGAEANGLKMIEVRVNVGDRVQQGDVLAVLQSDTLKAELAHAEATLAEAIASAQEARVQTDRAKSLQQQGFFSNAQLSQTLAADAIAQARVQSARAAVQLQTVRLSQTQVKSPDAGVISNRLSDVSVCETNRGT